MENYKKSLKNRNLWMILLIILIIAVYLILMVNEKSIDDFRLGFSLGAFVGIIGMLIVQIILNLIALNNEDRLKKMYIREHDERAILIMQKTGSIGFQISIIGLCSAALVSIFFNEIVFFSLIGAIVFLSFVKAVLKIYYSRKL